MLRVVSLLSLALLWPLCLWAESPVVTITGTVKKINLEGGFYGIVTPDEGKFKPVNLPGDFQVDGLKVMIKAKQADDEGGMMGIHMWGTPVKIVEIKRLLTVIGKVTKQEKQFLFMSEQGQKYQPTNLSPEYRVPGMMVYAEVVKESSGNDKTSVVPVSVVEIFPYVKATGTVKAIELEGGFYGIITPQGERYKPINLPKNFKVDNLPVKFAGKEVQLFGIAMWGKTIDLVEIKKKGKVAQEKPQQQPPQKEKENK